MRYVFIYFKVFQFCLNYLTPVIIQRYIRYCCESEIGFPTQVNFTCAQLRALVTPKNSRTVACNSAQLRATELRLETLIGNPNRKRQSTIGGSLKTYAYTLTYLVSDQFCDTSLLLLPYLPCLMFFTINLKTFL